jgi:hypothetical protein
MAPAFSCPIRCEQVVLADAQERSVGASVADHCAGVFRADHAALGSALREISKSRYRTAIFSPSNTRAKKRMRSSILEHSCHGICVSRKSVKCYPCARPGRNDRYLRVRKDIFFGDLTAGCVMEIRGLCQDCAMTFEAIRVDHEVIHRKLRSGAPCARSPNRRVPVARRAVFRPANASSPRYSANRASESSRDPRASALY